MKRLKADMRTMLLDMDEQALRDFQWRGDSVCDLSTEEVVIRYDTSPIGHGSLMERQNGQVMSYTWTASERVGGHGGQNVAGHICGHMRPGAFGYDGTAACEICGAVQRWYVPIEFFWDINETGGE